ncbi:MAG: hypothetical protein ACR9NN_25110 [Nostochopsis sp.]
MSLVVCGIHPSVSAAYRVKAEEMNVSRTAVYDKLNGVETTVSSAILRETAIPLASLIEFVGGKSPQILSGYKIRILDGNCLEKTDHRLEILRTIAAGALPGKSLVVLDPELRLAINVFACEDGHAQERSMFSEVLKTVKEGELWIADLRFNEFKKERSLFKLFGKPYDSSRWWDSALKGAVQGFALF